MTELEPELEAMYRSALGLEHAGLYREAHQAYVVLADAEEERGYPALARAARNSGRAMLVHAWARDVHGEDFQSVGRVRRVGAAKQGEERTFFVGYWFEWAAGRTLVHYAVRVTPKGSVV